MQLGALAWDELGGGRALVVEGVVERCGHRGDVVVRCTEGLGGEADLLDKPTVLRVVEVHVTVDVVLRCLARVGGEVGGAVSGAA